MSKMTKETATRAELIIKLNRYRIDSKYIFDSEDLRRELTELLSLFYDYFEILDDRGSKTIKRHLTGYFADIRKDLSILISAEAAVMYNTSAKMDQIISLSEKITVCNKITTLFNNINSVEACQDVINSLSELKCIDIIYKTNDMIDSTIRMLNRLNTNVILGIDSEGSDNTID